MGIAFVTLFFYNRIKREKLWPPKNELKSLFPGGLFTALHWIFFFGSIKASNISIGVVCMSTQAFMISIIQPLYRKTKMSSIEITLGVVVVFAMVCIFGFEYQYKLGIILGLISSFFAVCFTIINAGLTKRMRATVIAEWEMGFGFLLLSLYLLLSCDMTALKLTLHGNDIYYLLLLAIICTAVAFAVSVNIMRKLSAYTVSLSVNLEPVYTILLALLLFGEKEHMSWGFYAGTGVLLASVLTENLITKKS